MAKKSNNNNKTEKNIQEIKDELIQLIKQLKIFYSSSLNYSLYEIQLTPENSNDDIKYTIKHKIEEHIDKLKAKQEILEEIIQNLQSYIIHLKNEIHAALKQHNLDEYSKLNYRLIKLSEYIEKLYSSYNRTEEIIQKYYSMIIDYENKLLDNIVKTYKALLYKESDSDNELLSDLYENIEQILKNINTKETSNNDADLNNENNDLSLSDLPNQIIDDDRYKL